MKPTNKELLIQAWLKDLASFAVIITAISAFCAWLPEIEGLLKWAK